MQLDKLYKSTFEKVPFPRKIIERQKNLMRSSADSYNDDTDKEIAAMNFNRPSGAGVFKGVIKYVSAAAAVLIVLVVSSIFLLPSTYTYNGKFDFIPLPEQAAPVRNPWVIYPEKKAISQTHFFRLTDISLPDGLGQNFHKQNESAVAYYDSDGRFGLATCTASYYNPDEFEISFVVSTEIIPLPSGMIEEGNERIEGVDISLAVNKFKNVYYAYWGKNGVYILIRFEGITQREVENILTSFLSS